MKTTEQIIAEALAELDKKQAEEPADGATLEFFKLYRELLPGLIRWERSGEHSNEAYAAAFFGAITGLFAHMGMNLAAGDRVAATQIAKNLVVLLPEAIEREVTGCTPISLEAQNIPKRVPAKTEIN